MLVRDVQIVICFLPPRMMMMMTGMQLYWDYCMVDSLPPGLGYEATHAIMKLIPSSCVYNVLQTCQASEVVLRNSLL